jgi:hypothetical protein
MPGRKPLIQYLAAIPGAGKSTVLLEGQQLLAEALASGQLDENLPDIEFKERLTAMVQHGLIFYQEFRIDGTDGASLLESHWQLGNSSRLALRMLFAAVQGKKASRRTFWFTLIFWCLVFECDSKRSDQAKCESGALRMARSVLQLSIALRSPIWCVSIHTAS